MAGFSLSRLWLTDFRNYRQAELELAEGLTIVLGRNGEGKTNLLEAIAYLATMGSFRGAPAPALVRVGAERAIVRAELRSTSSRRPTLIEAEIHPLGRHRVMVNRQALRRARDLIGNLRVTVFSPDDLALVKGGPGERRQFLDQLLVSLQPSHDATLSTLERALRQRNALLRQSGGRLTSEVASTLDVWDARLADVGQRWGEARRDLVERLEPLVSTAYGELAGTGGAVTLTYVAPWLDTGLGRALAFHRVEDLRRGTTGTGPHRDDVGMSIASFPARTHVSQGEQRSLALGLRLAGHRLVEEVVNASPILLLDDVFSELDATRGAALLRHLPVAQTLVSTAGEMLDHGLPQSVLVAEAGTIVARRHALPVRKVAEGPT